jgi:short-subunit dehydrogenase
MKPIDFRLATLDDLQARLNRRHELVVRTLDLDLIEPKEGEQ